MKDLLAQTSARCIVTHLVMRVFRWNDVMWWTAAVSFLTMSCNTTWNSNIVTDISRVIRYRLQS